MKELIKKSNFWIKFSHSDFYLSKRKPNVYKEYVEELEFVKKLFSGGGVKLIFDVGGNIGFKTQQFLQVADKVVVFEPNEKMLHILKARFGNNARVVIVDKALSANEADLEFYDINDREAMSSLSAKHIETVVKNRNAAQESNIVKRTIRTATLDSFIAQYGTPDYLKIDVEGYEIEVIKGLSNPVPFISVEANLPEFLDETIEIINRLSTISNNTYKFNITSNNVFLMNEFQDKETTISFLQNTELKYLEVYAKLV